MTALLLALSGSLAASIVAKVTVITVVALFGVWLARGSRASVRHALLAAAFGVTLLLPLASVLVPPVHLGVPVAVENRASAMAPLVSGVEQGPPVLMTDDPDVRVNSVPLSSRISWSGLLLAGWIAGGAIFLLPLAIGLWQIRLLRRSGLPWRHGQSLADRIALDAGVRRRVEVLLHEGVPGPMTCGMVHPAIVLPRDAENWNGEDLNRAIVHELEHVRRSDTVSGCLARATCAVYWFHPLVWMAWRKLVLEAERSCDDAVLRRSEATAYAAQLVGLAERLSTTRRAPIVAMADRSDLAARVRALLDSRQRRGRAGALSLGLASTAVVALVLAMSPLILVATPQAAPSQTLPPQPDAVSVKPIDPLRLVAQSQPATAGRTVSATPAAPKFEVVSIRPSTDCSDGGGRGGGGAKSNWSPGRLSLECQTVEGLIRMAYSTFASGQQRMGPGIPIEKVPAGINSTRYTVNATTGNSKAEDLPSQATMKGPMLQAVLEDRFRLKIHRDTREVPVYALTVAKGGPKTLAPAQPGRCITVDADHRVPQPVAGQPLPKSCGLFYSSGTSEGIDVYGTTMAMLSRQFSALFDREVLDKTGIAGVFDIHLETSPADLPAPSLDADGRPGKLNPGDALNLVDSAVGKLGLKLEPTKGPGEFLVIDSVERPTEN